MHISNIPIVQVFIRNEYLYNLEKGHGEFTSGVIFGVRSIQGQALLFCALLENGAQIWNLPVSAIVTKQDAPSIPLDYLQLWDSLSYDISVHEFDFLSGSKCQVVLKDKSTHEGTYLFTIDGYGSDYTENYGDLGHKCFHIIELDNGCICAQPNNRILWSNSSFIANPFGEKPDYLINTHIWKCETARKWAAEDSNQMFYDLKITGCGNESSGFIDKSFMERHGLSLDKDGNIESSIRKR